MIFLIVFKLHLKAQVRGGNPVNLSWQILTSPSVRVIYPLGMEAQAQRIAGLINYMDKNCNKSIGPKKRRLDIVLQNQTVNPNGYVSLAPFRSEFYATPPSSNLLLGSLDWLDGLSIHEYRHAQQFTNSLTGLSKIGYYLQGEQLWAALNVISIPNWFSEGDAVIAETELSNSGRGRSPFFTIEQRALAYSNINYSFLKHRNESYKDMIPDSYRLGYMMLTRIRNEKGSDITAKLLHQAAAYNPVFYPFSNALKNKTGYTSKTLYYQAWEGKKKEFSNQLLATKLIPTNHITKKHKHTFTNYRFPCILENGDIIARKNSFKTTDEIVRLSKEAETHLTNIGFNRDKMLHYSNGMLVWTENSVNIRRENKNYSNIVLFDISAEKKTYLTKKTKYFSPSISPDGKLIAAVYISPDQQYEIHILDISNGTILNRIQTPLNYNLSRTTWSEDGTSIITIAKNKSQLAIIRLTINNSELIELTNWTSHTIDAPVVKLNKVFFNAGFTGIDNIFYTDTEGSKKIFQVTSVPIGAFDPKPSHNNEIYFTEYTEMGHIISKQNLENDTAAIPIEITEPSQMRIYKTIAKNTEAGNVLDIQSTSLYPSSSYNGFFRGLKIHSWGINPSISNPGLSVKMTNLLNDVSVELGSRINRNEKKSISYYGQFSVARYFPIITLTVINSKRQSDYYTNTNKISSQTNYETSLGLDVTVPLELQKGNFISNFRPQIGLNYFFLDRIIVENTNNSNFGSPEFGFLLSSKRRKAFQNVGCRLGIEIASNYATSFGNLYSNKLESVAKVFLPGFGKNHNLTLSASFQKENLNNTYQFNDVFEYPRGFSYPINDNFKVFKTDYHMPLTYPDIGFLSILYLKRVRGNVFFDYGVGYVDKINKSSVYNSAGIEILFDNVFLNVIPISFGVRQSFLITNDPNNLSRKTFLNFFFSGDLLGTAKDKD
jgi:hypothetical protein